MDIMNTSTKYRVSQQTVGVKPIVRSKARTRPSRGGTDEINPEDIIYGEYSNDTHGEYVDLIYVDGEIIRIFSGGLVRPNKTFDELVILLRDDSRFYLVEIKEIDKGFAFKRNDIVSIELNSVIEGNTKHAPSCIWTMQFEDRRAKTIEATFQSYFIYGKTIRPRNMTNQHILDKMLPKM